MLSKLKKKVRRQRGEDERSTNPTSTTGSTNANPLIESLPPDVSDHSLQPKCPVADDESVDIQPTPPFVAGEAALQSTRSSPVPASHKISPTQHLVKGQTYGLKVLYEPVDVSKLLVDIIFIHGLTGDSLNTWLEKESNVHWPTDLLKDDVDNARILAFGYDADVTKAFGPVSQNKISDHAQNLLGDLDPSRNEEHSKNRSIIFIVHSLGGLVLKKALCISKDNPEKHLQQADLCTIAIAFLGTPHRGSDLASFPTNVGKVLKTGGKRVNTDIIGILKKGSEMLADIEGSFDTWLRIKGSSVDVTCYYEELEFPGLGLVVTKDSAIIGGRLHYSIHANHGEMVKFRSRTDTGYKRIVDEIKRWLKPLQTQQASLIKVTEDKRASLQSLYFPEMHFRGNEISDPIDNTCGWILEHRNYLNWLGEHRGLLWIRGNPGAGKSTLLRHTFKQQETQEDLIVVSFFFHGRGAKIQKSLLGLFRSLIYQILQRIPKLLLSFHSLYKDKCETQGKVGEKWDWQLRELQDLFKIYVTDAAKIYPIYIFVDALDECGDEIANDFVEFFQRLMRELPHTKASLRICFSCRHYPLMDLKNGLQIIVEAGNQGDIETYIRSKLESGIQDRTKSKILQEDILERSSGVFQWVVLVVHQVLALYQKGQSLRFIQKRLIAIPTELNDLYQELLQSIDDIEKPQTLQLLQWICFALRPLSLTELRFALIADVETPYTSLAECQNAEEFAETDEEMEKKVIDLSRGLAEVKEYDDSEIVQFIHQSVIDYLIQRGLETLTNTTSPNSVIGSAHFRLSRSCIRYIAMEEMYLSKDQTEDNLSRKFPFLRYAVDSWIPHAEIVEKEHISQRDLLKYFWRSPRDTLQIWAEINLKFTHNHPQDTTILHIASQYNFCDLLIAILDINDVAADSKDGWGQTPLHLAAENGHEMVVKLLLMREDVTVNSKNNDDWTPLHFAAMNGHETVVKLLLSLEGVTNSRNKYGQTPLHLAAMNGHEAVVKLLLSLKDVTNSRNEWGYTPLQIAAKYGHEAVERLLESDIRFQEGSYVIPYEPSYD